MVRLQCDCGHVWKESKAEQESERVFCPKCGQLHHTHTPMKNPPKPPVYGKGPEPRAKVYRPILNPPKKITILKKDLSGKTIETTTGYKTEEKKSVE